MNGDRANWWDENQHTDEMRLNALSIRWFAMCGIFVFGFHTRIWIDIVISWNLNDVVFFIKKEVAPFQTNVKWLNRFPLYASIGSCGREQCHQQSLNKHDPTRLSDLGRWVLLHKNLNVRRGLPQHTKCWDVCLNEKKGQKLNNGHKQRSIQFMGIKWLFFFFIEIIFFITHLHVSWLVQAALLE